jgi:hypothetical protein
MRMGISRIGRFKLYESGFILTITVLAFLLMPLAQTAVWAEEGVKPYQLGRGGGETLPKRTDFLYRTC